MQQDPVDQDNRDHDSRLDALLAERQQLTDALNDQPYDFVLYLERAAVHSELTYPDLAAGDAYRALMLCDEVLNEGFEYHEQAVAAIRARPAESIPGDLRYASISSDTDIHTDHGHGPSNVNGDSNGDTHYGSAPVSPFQLARIASIRCFQMLSLNLLLCGCLKSAYNFCDRGLSTAPRDRDLLDTKGNILQVARKKLRRDDIGTQDLPDTGLVRREVYPWNHHEPDRFSDESLSLLNRALVQCAPKVAARVARLPVLLEGASETDDYEIIPTCDQLGLFATEEIAPGEVVLREYSLLTASNRLKESVCDACSTELPPLSAKSEAVSCPDCYDTVYCSEFCYSQAYELYHPAVCDKEVDAIAKDPDAKEADETLYVLLLARLLAMSNHQGIHPLQVKEVKYIWGDFVPSASNEINLSPKAGPPPEWTLPFSFKYHIEMPLHILEKMDIDIYTTLADHDLWVLNTLYSKFRGTASARKSLRDGRPDVAVVHPIWCLANHDCNPNVEWEWGARMTLWAKRERIVGNQPGGIQPGEEILNHYCDITLGVQERREWARGSLGGWCMCRRCRDEEAAMNSAGAANGVPSDDDMTE